MEDLGLILSNAIKEGKWLNLNYINKKEENTKFWCCILDIDFDKKMFKVHTYNVNSELKENFYIYFDSIIEAKIIEGTTYQVPEMLIKKIEDNIEKLTWLKYDTFNNNILQYLKECYQNDNDPYQKEYTLIKGIDYNELIKNERYQLSNVQLAEVIDNIYKGLNEKNNYLYQQLVLNILSITVSGKLYLVAYKNVLLDLYDKSLVLSKELMINKTFLIEGKKHTLSQYLDIPQEVFIKNLSNNLEEYKELLQASLHRNELLDDLPYLLILERNFIINIDTAFQAIVRERDNKTLGYPLNAFFGNSSVKMLKQKGLPIFFIDRKFNIDQLRVVYSALKNPITYVQGPPGTGKTSTITNIVLSSFINNKSVLLVSNNNKPVDDLYDKIKFYHKAKLVPFPILRLGKKEENIDALIRIKEMYEGSKEKIIRPASLSFIKNESLNNFKAFNEILAQYERRLDIIEKKDTLSMFLKTNKGIAFASMVGQQLKTLQDEYDKIGHIDENDVTKFTYIAEDDMFTQFLYYKSYQYLKELSKPEYKEFLAIINLPHNTDEEQKEMNEQFIKYLANEVNMALLLKVFPFIATTNLSSNRLGKHEKYFDLCIMDEAGQCNISTSLIPIIRCKNLVLIGDENQLQPVIVLEPSLNEKLMDKYKISQVYNYCDNSILKLMRAKDKVSPFILLRYHYRCGKRIIQFSNARYYDNKLNLENVLDGNQLEYISVKSDAFQENRNSSYQEAMAIIDILKKNKYNDVGVITPFRNQAKLIKELLKNEQMNNIEVGTIHTFQGDEKKVIILSTAITQATGEKTYNWVKNNNELINVAVTRAKEKLIVVGDDAIVAKKSSGNDDDLLSLTNYVKNKGNYVVALSKQTTLGLKAYDSKKETEFFQTISHFTSVVTDIEVKTKVKVSSVFSELNIYDKDFYFTGEFDFVLYQKRTKLPLLIVELDGVEHIHDYRSVRNDRRKERICHDNNIVLIRIPNNYVKRYEYVKELIIRCLS